jgi:hypothetical protein
MSTEPLDVVTLAGGGSVPRAALELLWDLQHRGFVVRRHPNGLLVKPTARITPADDAAIRTYRDELLVLVQRSETVQ